MSQVTTSLRPYTDYEEENSIPEMPWLDVELVRCNCSSFPEVGNIGVKSSSNGNNSQAVNDSSESESESDNDVSHEDVNSPTSHDSDNPNETPTLFTEYFKLKGSTYHAHFQDALRRCKRLSMDKRDISLKLSIEPANARDENKKDKQMIEELETEIEDLAETLCTSKIKICSTVFLSCTSMLHSSQLCVTFYRSLLSKSG